VVRLTNINPFAFQCSVTSTSQPYQETAISTFLGDIGGVANVGANTPDPSSPKTNANAQQGVSPPNSCTDQYGQQASQIVRLRDGRDAINKALNATLTGEKSSLKLFAADVREMRGQISCSATVAAATALINRDGFTIEPAGTVPLDEAVDELANQALALYPHLTDGIDAACKQTLAATINGDSAFLAALVHGTTAVPAAVDQWRAQLSQLKSVNDQLASAQATVSAVLQNRQNFSIDTPVSGNQTDVKVTANCTPVAVLQVPSTKATSSSSTPTSNPQTAAKPPVPSSWSQDFKFGPGPRFVLSGGLVISPLAQITYSTTSNPVSGGLPNIIIAKQESSARILPIAVLSGRFWDQLPYMERYRVLPNYLSVGITAKSTNNSGTNIEYLLGLSWAFANRQLVFTAGAYSGWQERLDGGLQVGQATSLSSSNLPISQTTIWKPGFTITWAPAGK